MSLPTLSLPQFEITLPISKKTLTYRPFLVKEEKLLYLAMLEEDQAKKAKAITTQLIAVLQNCVLTKDIDVSELPLVDYEYLFLKTKVASRGELSNINYRCKHKIKVEEKEKECNHLNELTISANDIEVVGLRDEKQNHIDCGSNTIVVMKYPSVKNLFDDATALVNDKNMTEVDMTINLLASFVDYFIYNNEIIEPANRQELIDWFDGLPETVLEKFKTYYETLPKMELKINFKCKACGYDHKVKLDNIYDFFTQH